MQPPTAYYPRYSSMMPQSQSAPITQSPHPQPHYPHPHYAPIHQSPPAQHHQYVYPTSYPQSPYVCVPTPSSSPTSTQYPVQQLHLMPPYMAQPQMQTPMQQLAVQHYVVSPKETSERDTFYAKLHAFRDEIGEPIQRLPTLGFKELDLWVLYNEVTKRRGIDSVIAKKQWKEVAEALQLPSSCTDSGFRLRLHYKKYLESFERKHYSPPPQQQLKKEAKKLERASSITSSDSTLTQLAGENSGSSGSRRSSGPASSSDSISKRDRHGDMSISKCAGVRKKKRAPTPVAKCALDGKAKTRVVETKIEENCAQDKNCAVEEEHSAPQPVVESVVDVVRSGGSESNGRNRVDAVEVEAKRVSEKEETRHNLSVLEAAVMAVDGRGLLAKKRKPKKRNKKVDFSVLDDSTLKRYAKAYDVNAPSKEEEADKNGKWKRELAESVSAHFSETPLAGGEHETLLRFIQAVRRA